MRSCCGRVRRTACSKKTLAATVLPILGASQGAVIFQAFRWLAVDYTRSTIFSILPRAVRAFREAHPQVHLELVAMLAEHQREALLSGRIQLGIARYTEPPGPDPALIHSPLFDRLSFAIFVGGFVGHAGEYNTWRDVIERAEAGRFMRCRADAFGAVGVAKVATLCRESIFGPTGCRNYSG